MVQFDVTTGISGSFIDISADIEVDDVVPEEGLIKVLDIVFNDVLVKAQRKRNSFKFQIICQGEFKKQVESTETLIPPGFRTKMMQCLKTSNLEEVKLSCHDKLVDTLEKFESRGSGWIFVAWTKVIIKLAKWTPTSASSYLPTPANLRHKRCLLNIRNRDNLCFLYCVAASFPEYLPKRNRTNAGPYKQYLDRFNIEGIEMPVSVVDVPLFEELNNVCCNIFEFDEEIETNIKVLYKSDKDFDKVVNLLIIEEGDKRHYILIKSMEALLRPRSRHTGKIHTCKRCFRGFYSASAFQKHEHYCRTGEPAVEMPENPIMKFKNYQNRIPNSIIIYADFEAYQQPVDIKVGKKTTLICQQKPTGYGYIVVSPFTDLNQPSVVYRGENAAEKFVEALHNEYEKAQHIFENDEDMIFTSDDAENFENSTNCIFCNKVLDWSSKKDCVVKDHCHISGKFRGAAHASCNVNAPKQSKIFIYFHNGKGYDNHFIIEALAANKKTRGIEIIGNTKEKYVQIKTKRFLIHDSMSHLSSGLDTLADSLKKKGQEHFTFVKQEFRSNDKFKCALQKLVYPYDYVTDFSKFNEPIPTIDVFYNKLNDEELCESDYERLLDTCKVFGVTTLGELHDLYLRIDVLLLASVFENYRKVAMATFDLDPSYYISSPSFSFDAMLLYTNVNLELIQDQGIYEFLEKGLRGGCSTIYHRLATSNTKEIEELYDPRIEGSTIKYFDCNNLYGFIMLKKLPHHSFTWMVDSELKKLNFNDFDVNGDISMILEVDLSYPVNLHDKHKDFPLAPENITITRDMLSPEMSNFLDNAGMKFNAQKRLTQNFLPKKNYVVHINNLIMYLQEGMILENIHRGVKFHQSAWMKDYIEVNTELRRNANSKFEKDLFKLLINSIFGKTCENPRRYKNLKLVKTNLNAKKQINKAEFASYTIINSNLVVAELKQTTIKLCKPMYTGMVILDLSKLHMYKFHYWIMQNKFPDELQLCFSDTDSLCYIIKKSDVTADLQDISNFMDFSNYPENHILYSTENKQTPGRFKDETEGDPIIQFCGLRAKSYSIVTQNDRKVAAAGIKKSHQHRIPHWKYVETLADSSLHSITQNTIISRKHKIYVQSSSRTALSYLDIKRIVLNDGITTVPYGYKGSDYKLS